MPTLQNVYANAQELLSGKIYLSTVLLKTSLKKAAALGVEIVFVSSDQTEEAMLEYMKEAHGDWFAVPYESKVAEELSKKFGELTWWFYIFYSSL